MTKLEEKVYNFPTKNQEGFTNTEIDLILKDYPRINMDKFNDALRGVTGMVINNEFVYYHSDIERALRCGIYNRGLNSVEWD